MSGLILGDKSVAPSHIRAQPAGVDGAAQDKTLGQPDVDSRHSNLPSEVEFRPPSIGASIAVDVLEVGKRFGAAARAVTSDKRTHAGIDGVSSEPRQNQRGG